MRFSGPENDSPKNLHSSAVQVEGLVVSKYFVWNSSADGSLVFSLLKLYTPAQVDM